MLQHLSVPLFSGVLDNLAYISRIHNLLRGDLRHACSFRKTVAHIPRMCNPSAEFSELTCAMRQYLVIYNRRAGEIIRHRRFQGAANALAARFKAEREFREQPDAEIVVLGAASWDALKQTHSRYFKPAQELAGAALEREASSH